MSSSNMGVDGDPELLVKTHNKATIASLRPKLPCVGLKWSIKHILYYQSTQRLFSS